MNPVPRRRRRDRDRAAPGTSHQTAGPVAGYEIIGEIGRGASGRVYRATQSRMSRQVALKLLDAPPDDRDARRRFDRELSITVRLGSHPHITQVLDAGQATDGRPYLAMELFERGSAGDWLARHGPFPAADAVRAGIAIADALAAAHSAGVLHRDVKPENILLSEYGPALTDFGIARPADQLDRTSSFSQFTPWHAAPEVLLDGAPTEAADVYSLASTLFTLVDGRPPFAGPAGETLLAFQRRVLTEDHRPLPAAVGPGLAEVVLAALTRDPDRRIATATELRDRLRAVAGGATPVEGPGPGAADAGPVGAVPPPPPTGPAVDGAPIGADTLPPDPLEQGPDLAATAPRRGPTDAGSGSDTGSGPATAPPPPPPPPSSGTASERAASEVGQSGDSPSRAAATEGSSPAPPSGPLGDRGDLSLTRAAATAPDPERPGSLTDGPTGRSRWPLAVGAPVLLAVLVLAAWFAWFRPDDPEPVPPPDTSPPTVAQAPPTAAGIPTDVDVVELDATTVSITWTDTTGGAGTTLVRVAPEGGSAPPVEVEQGAEQQVIADLEPAIGYCFAISVFAATTDSPDLLEFRSDPACIRGATPAEPTPTTASPVPPTTPGG